jgi:hypothetical protein
MEGQPIGVSLRSLGVFCAQPSSKGLWAVRILLILTDRKKDNDGLAPYFW